ncbi:hypothetical protein [Burkholderia gladioli]|uniref:hypothetical protein n=1 Tax=Burkholderia gladioli TaxID=28095 RepID=UPI0011B20735|nr:hypothetical protein [Burkholderia gladioli]
MNVENEETTKKHIADWPWAAIVLVVGWIVFGLAYSSGDAYYRAFLSYFSVEADGFPIDQNRHFLLSQIGGLNSITIILNWFGENPLVSRVLIICYVLFLVIVTISNLTSSGKENKLARYVTERQVLSTIRGVIVSWCIIPLGLVCLLMSLIVVTSLPAAFAGAAGKMVAGKVLRDFERGCDRSSEKCQIALKGGHEIARGYVIAQSPTRIAIFNNGETTQIPLDGIELRTVTQPPTAQQPSR